MSDTTKATVERARLQMIKCERDEAPAGIADCAALAAAQTELQEARQERNALAAQVATLREALESVDEVIRNSHGVDGWHLNGDIAPWGQLGLDSEVANALSTPPTQAEQVWQAMRDVCKAAKVKI